MNDDLNLKISQLIDDELSKAESVKLLELIHKHPELENKLRRYEIVAGVVKSDRFMHADDDFVSKVSQGIQQEAIVFAPNRLRPRFAIQTLSAIAASVAVIAIIVFGGLNSVPDLDLTSNELQATLALTEKLDTKDAIVVATQVKPETIIVAVATVKENKAKVDPRFIEYLEAHDNSLYAAGSPGFQSYIKVVSYGQK